MRKFSYFIIGIVFLISCEKDDNETIDMKLLIGNWQEIKVELSNGCNDYLEFSDEAYRTKKVCTNSSSFTGFISYDLEGNTILNDGSIVFEIDYLSQDLLKLYDAHGAFHEYKKP